MNKPQSALFKLLEPYGQHNLEGRWFDWLLMVLIVTNVVAATLETVPSFAAEYGPYLWWFEVISVIIFTLEYVCRIWVCVLESGFKQSQDSPFQYRLKFLLRPMSLIDLLAILPFYLSFLVSIDLRALRLIRLTRLLKLSRYSTSMQMLHAVIAKEYRVIIAALTLLMITMVIAATAMHFIEQEAQPEHFGSIPQAMWWSLITLSTVGYGDVAPITTAGKILSGVFIMLGVAIFALPAGILASSFTEQMSLKRDQFRSQVLNLLANGHLSLNKLHHLDHVRQSLGLDKDEAELLLTNLKRQEEKYNNKSDRHCPHCKKPLS